MTLDMLPRPVQYIVWAIAIVLVGVSLLNPGGTLLALLIALIVIALVYGLGIGLELKMNRDFGRNAGDSQGVRDMVTERRDSDRRDR